MLSNLSQFNNPNIGTGSDIDFSKDTGLDWIDGASENIIQIINPVIPKDANTGSKSRLYRFPFREEAETSQSPTTYQMHREFNEIITCRSASEAEDEISPFIIEAKKWLEKYGVEATELMKMYLHSSIPTDSLISEIMDMLGDVSNQASYDDRKEMLEIGVKSEMPEMRYGSALGLANMRSTESIPLLKKVLSKEKNTHDHKYYSRGHTITDK